MTEWDKTREICANCKFWPLTHSSDREWRSQQPMKTRPLGIGGINSNGLVSQCRKSAPVRDFAGDADRDLFGSGRWPTTAGEDFCGDFEKRPRESKER